ncbi:MAG: hypothetical protein J5832_05680 [Clostridia bacterium]|nr:hypothetical protein [Clostridia bacterium]
MSELLIDSLNGSDLPVIVVDENGRIAGKNLAAYKYIPKLRLGLRLQNIADLSDDGTVTLRCDSSTFKRALAIDLDGGKTLYVFTTKLQNGNDGGEKSDVCKLTLNEALGKSDRVGKPHRLYREIADAFGHFDPTLCGTAEYCDIDGVFKLVERRLSSGFRSLGYSARLSLTESAKAQRFFTVNVSSLVYAVMRCAYIAMRLSQNGSAEVTVDFDETAEELVVSASAKTDKALPRGTFDAYGAISYLVPETAIEMKIDGALQSGVMSKARYALRDGLFTLDVPMAAKPYSALVLHARSARFETAIKEIFYRFAEKTRRCFKK